MLFAACLIVLMNNLYSSEATDYGVKFSFYHGENVDNPFFTYSLGSSVTCNISSVLNITKYPLYFYIHGYEEEINDYEKLLINVTSKVLTKYVIVKVTYDYNEFFLTTAASLPAIGNQVGQFLSCLYRAYGYSPKNSVCVGHSYGAHLCGIAGRYLKGIWKYIVGLDPASELLSSALSSFRLTPDDGQYVEVIHTSILLGTALDSGHSDFRINKGTVQTGCTFLSNCSHLKAILYYVNTLQGIKYIGTSTSGNTAYMGGDPLDETAKGNYYLTI